MKNGLGVSNSTLLFFALDSSVIPLYQETSAAIIPNIRYSYEPPLHAVLLATKLGSSVVGLLLNMATVQI